MYVCVCVCVCVPKAVLETKNVCPASSVGVKKVAIYIERSQSYICIHPFTYNYIPLYICTECSVRDKERISGQLGRREKVARRVVLDRVHGRTPFKALIGLTRTITISLSIYIRTECGVRNKEGVPRQLRRGQGVAICIYIYIMYMYISRYIYIYSYIYTSLYMYRMQCWRRGTYFRQAP